MEIFEDCTSVSELCCFPAVLLCKCTAVLCSVSKYSIKCNTSKSSVNFKRALAAMKASEQVLN